jgi:hypothetical protein
MGVPIDLFEGIALVPEIDNRLLEGKLLLDECDKRAMCPRSGARAIMGLVVVPKAEWRAIVGRREFCEVLSCLPYLRHSCLDDLSLLEAMYGSQSKLTQHSGCGSTRVSLLSHS